MSVATVKVQMWFSTDPESSGGNTNEKLLLKPALSGAEVDGPCLHTFGM